MSGPALALLVHVLVLSRCLGCAYFDSLCCSTGHCSTGQGVRCDLAACLLPSGCVFMQLGQQAMQAVCDVSHCLACASPVACIQLVVLLCWEGRVVWGLSLGGVAVFVCLGAVYRCGSS